MTRKTIILLLFSLFSLGGILAQNVRTNQLTLDQNKVENSCFTKSKYYFKSFNRIGDKPLPSLETAIEKALVTVKEADEKSRYWMYQDWVYSVKDEADADYTITAEYDYNSGIIIGETVYKEKQGNIRLPYFVTAKEHRADLDIYFTFNYKDGTPSRKDTISVHKKSVEKPGASYYSVEKLEKQLEGMMKAKVAHYKEFINSSEIQINFPKVKIKDKALKTEYASINSLLKEGEYEKAGSIVKKAYEANPTPELSQALGICYEIVGNYPKAAKYYEALPNFHIKVRMKKNMAVLDFAKSLGFTPEYIEF